MNIPYAKVNNEIFKILQGLDYTIKMFDQDGSGPISSPKLAKYIYVEPAGSMISLPDGSADDYNEVIFYKGSDLNIDDFKNIKNRLQNLLKLYGIGLRVESFTKRVEPKNLAYKVKARQEEMQEQVSIKSLRDYLK